MNLFGLSHLGAKSSKFDLSKIRIFSSKKELIMAGFRRKLPTELIELTTGEMFDALMLHLSVPNDDILNKLLCCAPHGFRL